MLRVLDLDASGRRGPRSATTRSLDPAAAVGRRVPDARARPSRGQSPSSLSTWCEAVDERRPALRVVPERLGGADLRRQLDRRARLTHRGPRRGSARPTARPRRGTGAISARRRVALGLALRRSGGRSGASGARGAPTPRRSSPRPSSERSSGYIVFGLTATRPPVTVARSAPSAGCRTTARRRGSAGRAAAAARARRSSPTSGSPAGPAPAARRPPPAPRRAARPRRRPARSPSRVGATPAQASCASRSLRRPRTRRASTGGCGRSTRTCPPSRFFGVSATGFGLPPSIAS